MDLDGRQKPLAVPECQGSRIPGRGPGILHPGAARSDRKIKEAGMSKAVRYERSKRSEKSEKKAVLR